MSTDNREGLKLDSLRMSDQIWYQPKLPVVEVQSTLESYPTRTLDRQMVDGGLST